MSSAAQNDPLKRGSAALVGVAESDLGEVAEGMSAVDLMAQGTVRALDDCGLTLADVDGVFAAATQSRMATTAVCEYLGIQPRYHDGTYMGGSSFMSMVAHAQAAIQSGLCEVAVITYGSTQRTSGRNAIAQRDFARGLVETAVADAEIEVVFPQIVARAQAEHLLGKHPGGTA